MRNQEHHLGPTKVINAQLNRALHTTSSKKDAHNPKLTFIQCLPQDLQVQLEEEARIQEELREEQTLLERRCTLLVTEREESRASLEVVERSRKALETELQETSERYNELDNQVHTLWRR